MRYHADHDTGCVRVPQTVAAIRGQHVDAGVRSAAIAQVHAAICNVMYAQLSRPMDALMASNPRMTFPIRPPKPARAQTAREARPPLHPRNRHQGRYDVTRLTTACPALAAHLLVTPAGTTSIDFSDPAAVRELNRAILRADYDIAHWTLPDGYLCPPIPGRADYLHGLADLLAEGTDQPVPRGPGVRMLDVGVGANCIYPLLAQAEYGWRCVGSDIDKTSLQLAGDIVEANGLAAVIELRHQAARGQMFKGVVAEADRFDLTLCNPPFHASAEEAARGSQRKLRNLGNARATSPVQRSLAPTLNFGGHANELWCTGGEASFVRRMIRESIDIRGQVLWFSSLVAKSQHLADIHKQLHKVGAVDIREVAMAQGSKQSRFVAWTYHDAAQRAAWRVARPGTV